MKAFSSTQPWLLLFHTNTALSSIFTASPSRIEEEASAVRPTLSLEWQEDEIGKYLSEPLSFPQPTLPLGYPKPTFYTKSNPQELQHQSPPNALAIEVNHTPMALLPSNGVHTSSGVLSLKDVPASRSDLTTCDLTCSNESSSIGDPSPVGGLTLDAQLTPDHNDFARKREGDGSVSKAKSDLVPARKKMKVTKDNKKSVLHADHPIELPKSIQGDQSTGRKAPRKRTNTKRVVLETLMNLSDSKIQIENNLIFKDIMNPRRSQLKHWKSKNNTAAGDARTRVRILGFLENVTKMSTFLIISHASLLNGQIDKKITQCDVDDALRFMKDFWEKMDRNETLVTLRSYIRLPSIKNLLDPNDTRTYPGGHTGNILWYEACEEIVEYWTEQNMNPLWRSSFNTDSKSHEFDIRRTVNYIIADRTHNRFTRNRDGSMIQI
ncbi:hypothetical protein MJO28_015464 [Puccinia striiformis f. sp. tritici]|uniref:Uncharacterized protein n=3 Tax=Puccinia striiformis TaxID=27350 RepID=A0A2S4VFI2_9BASI|nr:hypothetical protein Pst134EA_028226 [Puccinia striiformis f. sp. tritici]KAH9448938.1 hypothetical protein Pst134EA_028226 [Puccinia striiformis f. sp. tritici]KAI7938544.1 hypothetical protein MJO28_015464 [Puccinia striiformis f. sp. tritici]POW08301.1 hypothetical protein PSHT_09602 [Puccinia striiformis]